MVLNVEERDDTKLDFPKVEEQQVKSGHGAVAEEGNDSIETALQEFIADDIMQKVESAMVTISHIFGEAVGQLFHSSTPQHER